MPLTSIAKDGYRSFSWRYLFVFSFLLALVAYGYPLFNFSLNIDGGSRDNFEHTVSLGRWGHALIRAYILPEPYIPYFTMLLALAITACAAVLHAWVVGLNKRQSMLFCALYITFPQFAYQFEFMNQAETFALGQLLCAISVALFCLARERGVSGSAKLLAYVFSVVAYSWALGIYQTLAFVPPAILLARLLFSSRKKPVKIREDINELIVYFFMAVAAAILYTVASMIVQRVYGVDGSDYFLIFYQPSEVSVREHLHLVINNMLVVLKGEQSYGLVTFCLSSLVVIWSFAVVIWRRSLGAVWQAFLATSILIVPLLVLMTSQYMLPPRTFVAENFALAVLVTYALTLWRKELSVGVVAIVSAIHISFVTQLFYSDTLARDSDVFLANRIMTTITQQVPDFDESETPVYFHGGYDNSHRYALPSSDFFGSSFFDWDGGNNLRLISFFRYYGIAQFIYTEEDKVREILPYVLGLPTWPNPGAIEYHNGVVIVKLGEKPGWFPFEVE